MRLTIEKVSNSVIISSQVKDNSNNLPPVWIKQVGLEWFYFAVCKILFTLE
ncbi:hypothetical protein L8106_01947 [Lyngbya sp. PCC 8106]|nr:hypothetical protein L8106_01947 [Lyngbya sp. PCC 8106]